MDCSGQYDSDESLPDPEKGTDASPGDAEDSPWSPPESLVEDEADSGSDSDEEEGDNEYGEEEGEDWEQWNEYLGKGTKAETVAECNDPAGESEETMDADEEGDHVAPDAGSTDEEADEEVAYQDVDRETDEVAEGNDPAGESEERMEAGLVAPDAGLTDDEVDEEDEDLVFFDADDPVVPEPRVGMRFLNPQMAEAYGRRYFADKYVSTCTPQKGKKCLWVACVHFGKYRSRCTGKRPNQFSIKMECPAVIKFSTLESSRSTRIQSFSLEHNHPCNEAFFKADTQIATSESKAVIKSLMKAQCKVGQIQLSLSQAGKKLTFPKEMADDVPEDLQDDEWPEEDPGGLTQNEKFARFKVVIDQIKQWLSYHNTPQILSYVPELWEIADRIRRGERLFDRCGCAISECDEECACRQDQEGEESVAPRAGIKYTPRCTIRGRPSKRRPRLNFKAANDEDKAAQSKGAKGKGGKGKGGKGKGPKGKGAKEMLAKVLKGNKENNIAKGKDPSVPNARKTKPLGNKAIEKRSATGKPKEKDKTGEEPVTLSDTEYDSEPETSNGKQAYEDWAIKIAGKDEPLKHEVAQTILCRGASEFPCPFSNNDVTLAEFSTLAHGGPVSDGLVNWWLRYLLEQFSKFHPEEKQVLVLSTEFYALLRDCTWPDSCETPPESLRTRLDKSLAIFSAEEGSNMGGHRFIVVPLVEQNHYYVMVYIADAERPQLVVLESMGNQFASYPAATDRFIKLLGYYRKQWNTKQVVVAKSLPAVPRQEASSNDCALFAIKFMERLLAAPGTFEDLLNAESLHLWFDSGSVGNKRKEIIDEMIQESRDQRRQGCPTFFTLSSRGILIQNFRRSNGRRA